MIGTSRMQQDGSKVESRDADLEGIRFRLVLQATVLGEHAGQALDGSARQGCNILLPPCAQQTILLACPLWDRQAMLSMLYMRKGSCFGSASTAAQLVLW